MVPMLRLLYVISKQTIGFLGVIGFLTLKVDVIGIGSRKPSLYARIVPCPEVNKPDLNIPFLCCELLADAVAGVAQRRCDRRLGRRVLRRRVDSRDA